MDGKKDGKIIIGTEVDTSKFERQIKKLQLKKEDQKIEIEATTKNIKESEKQLKYLEKQIDEVSQRYDKLIDQKNHYEKLSQKPNLTPEENLDVVAFRDFGGYTALENTQEKMEELELRQQSVKNYIEEQNRLLERQNFSYNEIDGKIEDVYLQMNKTTQKINEAEKKAKQIKLDKIKEQVNGVGKSVEKITSKIGRWALAIFGVRTAYNFIRSAISTIASQDDQLNADIQYMKNSLAYAVEPVVRTIVDLAKQVLQHVAQIIFLLTGKNIFENADKSLENSKKNAKGLNKELQKTLANFDEMNVLQDNSSSGGDNDDDLPSFRFKDIEEMKVPKWMQWILDNKDGLIAGLAGIAGALTALKLGISPLKALGIGITIGGIVLAVEKLLAYLKDPTWENFGGFLEGIGIAIMGIALLVGSLPVAVVGAVVTIFGVVATYWEEIHKTLQNGINWLIEQTEWVKEHFGIVGVWIYEHIIRLLQLGLDYWDRVFRGVKSILDGIIDFIGGIFTGDWNRVWEGVKSIFSGVFNVMFSTARMIFEWIVGLIKDKIKVVTKVVTGIKDAFVNTFSGLWDSIKGFIEDTATNIKNTLDPGKIVNNVKSGLSGIGNGIKNFFGFAKGGIIYPPKLAVGGIINQPGRGVPLTSAIGGEHGAEGVIPLTDSQQMQLLGEAIGKYITINASITNTMNGRVISRELQKVQNDMDFAMNR